MCLRQSCGQNRGVTQAQLPNSAPPANAKLTTQPRTGAGRRRPARTSLISCLRLHAYRALGLGVKLPSSPGVAVRLGPIASTVGGEVPA